MWPIRVFVLIEAIGFAAAASVHAGLLYPGYEHRAARNAESVLAAVLCAGFVATWVIRRWTRQIGMTVQGFALLGTLVGVFTIVVGVGPRTLPDIVYHVAMIVLLVWGIAVAARTPAAPRT